MKRCTVTTTGWALAFALAGFCSGIGGCGKSDLSPATQPAEETKKDDGSDLYVGNKAERFYVIRLSGKRVGHAHEIIEYWHEKKVEVTDCKSWLFRDESIMAVGGPYAFYTMIRYSELGPSPVAMWGSGRCGQRDLGTNFRLQGKGPGATLDRAWPIRAINKMQMKAPPSYRLTNALKEALLKLDATPGTKLQWDVPLWMAEPPRWDKRVFRFEKTDQIGDAVGNRIPVRQFTTFIEAFEANAAQVWLDEQGQVVRKYVPHIRLEYLLCPKAVAEDTSGEARWKDATAEFDLPEGWPKRAHAYITNPSEGPESRPARENFATNLYLWLMSEYGLLM